MTIPSDGEPTALLVDYNNSLSDKDGQGEKEESLCVGRHHG